MFSLQFQLQNDIIHWQYLSAVNYLQDICSTKEKANTTKHMKEHLINLMVQPSNCSFPLPYIADDNQQSIQKQLVTLQQIWQQRQEFLIQQIMASCKNKNILQISKNRTLSISRNNPIAVYTNYRVLLLGTCIFHCGEFRVYCAGC